MQTFDFIKKLINNLITVGWIAEKAEKKDISYQEISLLSKKMEIERRDILKNIESFCNGEDFKKMKWIEKLDLMRMKKHLSHASSI